MSDTDEIMQALDSLGRAALEVKRQRDVLTVAFKKIRDILVETEIQIEQAESASEDSRTSALP